MIRISALMWRTVSNSPTWSLNKLGKLLSFSHNRSNHALMSRPGMYHKINVMFTLFPSPSSHFCSMVFALNQSNPMGIGLKMQIRSLHSPWCSIYFQGQLSIYSIETFLKIWIGWFFSYIDLCQTLKNTDAH